MKTTGVSCVPKFGLLDFLGHPSDHLQATEMMISAARAEKGEEMIRWSRQRLLLQKNRSDCAKTCLQRSTFKPLVKQGESKPANYQDCYCLYLLTKSSGITRQKNLPKQQIDATAFLWMQWLQRQILWIFWNPVSRGCRWPEAGWPLGPGWLLHRLFPRDQL